MNIEKRNSKMFNIITAIVLVAILLTAISGIITQRQLASSKDGGMDMNRSANSLQPESAQSGPTGRLVMGVGIFLLTVGFGVLVTMLLFRRNLPHRKPS